VTPSAVSRNTASPLARAASALPAPILAGGLLVATVAAIAAAFVYAYDQDVLFPDRHFPRTWVLVSAMAAVSALSLPLSAVLTTRSAWLAAFTLSLGAGVLFFGGANLANKNPGVIALAAGAGAWLAAAALAHNRRQPADAIVAGLAAAAAFIFAVVGFCVVAVSGSA
jgi:hypothetical protein